MLGHVVFSDETLATVFKGADEGSIARVEEPMSVQICLMIKLLGTQFTFVGFVGTMFRDVFGKGVLLRKPFSACWTLVELAA